MTRRTSRPRVCSSSRSRRAPGIFAASSLYKVSTAQAKKQAAPNAVFQFAAARSRTEPVDGTTYPAMAEMPKKMQPSRLIAGCHHPRAPRAGSHPCRDEAW